MFNRLDPKGYINGDELQFIEARGPCISAQGISGLMAYAPNASIIISADNLAMANGAVLKLLTTKSRRIDLFANRVAITGDAMPVHCYLPNKVFHKYLSQ